MHISDTEKNYVVAAVVMMLIMILVCGSMMYPSRGSMMETYAPTEFDPLYFSPWYNTTGWIPRWRRWSRYGPYFVPYRERRWWKRRFLY